jgi:four helix bundle protein
LEKSSVQQQQLKHRTKTFALRVMRLVDTLPDTRSADVVGKQLLRAATSVGANYRAACRPKSTNDMINKLKIVEEEADESTYWMELLVEAEMVSEARLADLMNESNEILAMTVASVKTLRAKHKRLKQNIDNS